MAAVQVPTSPGVGARRRGPKSLPKLPLSAFTPPNSGTSDCFPLPPSPSALHPEFVVDALASIKSHGLDHWKSELAHSLSSDRMAGVVVSLPSAQNADQALSTLLSSKTTVPILSVVVPLDLEHGPPSPIPSIFTLSNLSLAISTVFSKPNPNQVEGIKWALTEGLVVHIDVQCDLIYDEEGWEALEDLLSACVGTENVKGRIILSNILPPPKTLSIPLVKLLNHPTYRAYQARVAALSLFPSTFINFLPPDWDAVTPPTPPPPGAALSPVFSPVTPNTTPIVQDSKEKREWKRRIKMYLGPVLEAFGFQRIMFGSSPSSNSRLPSNVGDWYELARESFAELGVDQSGIDAVFGSNAQRVYESKR